MARILVTVPVPKISLIYKYCWDALLKLNTGDHTVNLFVSCENLPNVVGDQNIGYNLNQARAIALDLNYDYLMIVESDVVPPENALLELLKVEAQVVVGLVPERPSKVKTDQFIICMDWNKNQNASALIAKGEPFEMTGSDGYACILIKRELLSAISFPEQGSSDMCWYDTIHKAGLKVFCQPSVKCAHVDRDGRVIIRNNP